MTRIHSWWKLSSAIKWDRWQSFEWWIRLKSSCQIFVLFCFYRPTLLSRSPWYNRNGWLGVKHQVTYSSHEAILAVLHNTAEHTAIVSLSVCAEMNSFLLLFRWHVCLKWVLYVCPNVILMLLQICVFVGTLLCNCIDLLFIISSEKLKRGWTLTTSQYTITHILYFKTQNTKVT